MEILGWVLVSICAVYFFGLVIPLTVKEHWDRRESPMDHWRKLGGK